MSLNSKMTAYEAPEGYVYDYKELPEGAEHLYAKYLYLTRYDSIDNYKLVEDPRNDSIGT